MSSSSSESNLTPTQQTALTQVLELTGNCDIDVAVGVLSSVDWDVQRAAEMIFDNGPIAPPRAGPSPSDDPTSGGLMEELEIDDTEQDTLLRRTSNNNDNARPGPTASVTSLILRPLFSLLSLPLTLLTSLLRFVFLHILRVPFPGGGGGGPFLHRFSGLVFLRRSPSSSSSSSGATSRRGLGSAEYRSPEMWVRELEEETGAVSIARLKVPKGVSSSVSPPGASAVGGEGSSSSSSNGAGAGSGLTARNVVGTGGFNDLIVDPTQKLLPDFLTTTYEEALRTAQRDARILCVILVSEEHDDVAEFKRSTLTNTEFVRTLHNNDILVWGGDVKDREAWSASEKLQATTYPFIAFLALQPRRLPTSSRLPSSSTSSSTSPPSLTVLSRHSGPSHPSPDAPTSPHTLTTHIHTLLLPRITPYLTHLRTQALQRTHDRALRSAQDRAFASAAQRDRARLQAHVDAETRLAEERRQAALLAAESEARRAKETEHAERVAEVRRQWREWTRRSIILEGAKPDRGSGAGGGGGTLRLAIRLPKGERVIQHFAGSTDDLTVLYAFIDTHLSSVPPTSSSSPSSLLSPPPPSSSSTTTTTTATSTPTSATTAKNTLESHILAHPTPASYWGFTLATSFPRTELPWAPHVRLCEVPLLRGGAQVVVELAAAASGSGMRGSPRRGGEGEGGEGEGGEGEGDDDDDGYETEED